MTEPVWDRALADERIMYVDHDGADYPGGYFDIKLATLAYLHDAVDHGDDPVRDSLLHSRVVVHARPRARRPCSPAAATSASRCGSRAASPRSRRCGCTPATSCARAIKRQDPLLIANAALHTVVAADRALLALNRRLFAGPKYLRSAVESLPVRPAGWTELADRLLSDPGPETRRCAGERAGRHPRLGCQTTSSPSRASSSTTNWPGAPACRSPNTADVSTALKPNHRRSTTMSTTPRAVSLRAEYRTDTPFTASATPRLSWATETETEGWLQASAELELTRGGATASHSVSGRDSVLLDWPFDPIAPRETVSLRVRVTGEDGGASEWSEPADARGRSARPTASGRPTFIGLDDERPKHPARLRTEFAVDGEVARATLYATAHGAYQVEINGIAGRRPDPEAGLDQLPVAPDARDDRCDRAAAPTGRTRSASTSRAPGSPRASASPTGLRAFYGAQPSSRGAARHRVRGRPRPTRSSPTPLAGIRRRSDPGERHLRRRGHRRPPRAGRLVDGRLRRAAAGLRRASRSDGDGHAVVPTPRSAPAVREIETLPVRDVITTPEGKTVVDFGQNLVGYLHLKVSGPSGTVLTLRHAEVLEHGELGVRPLRAAAATDTFTLAGDGVEEWKPRFTFHGFRYAEISGWPGEFDPTAVTAIVVHSDMERTGWFESSHALVEPSARERRVGHEGQLPLPADRLPAARRAPRLDRRHPGVRADRDASSTTATASWPAG